MVAQATPTPRTPAATLRRRVFDVIESGADTVASRIFDSAIIALIVTAVVAFAADTVPDIQRRFHHVLRVTEWVTTLVFTVEYALRLWVCIEHPQLRRYGPIRARIFFALRPSLLIDLAAILPFFVVAVAPADFVVLRVLRLVRFLKLARFSPALGLLGRVFYAERRALFGALIVMTGMLLLSATVMYIIEGPAQPDKFGTIPNAMWWAVVTLTTVGYGDVVPVTVLGRLFGGIVMIMGLGMFALPVSILATGFVNEAHRREFVVTWGRVSAVPIFAELDAHAVGEIVALLRSMIVPPNAVIAHRGEMADAMYFIVAGEVELEVEDEPVRLGPGDFFGEVALLDTHARSVNARARTRCDLLVIEADDFRTLMRRRPDLRQRVRATARSCMLGDWGHVQAGEELA